MQSETPKNNQPALNAWKMLLKLSLIVGISLILLYLAGCSKPRIETLPEERLIDDLLITVPPMPDWETYPKTIGGLWLYMEDLEDWSCDTLKRYGQLVDHASKGKQKINRQCDES